MSPKDVVVGEQYRIIANTCGHDYALGTVITITDVHNIGGGTFYVKNGATYIKADCIEFVDGLSLPEITLLDFSYADFLQAGTLSNIPIKDLMRYAKNVLLVRGSIYDKLKTGQMSSKDITWKVGEKGKIMVTRGTQLDGKDGKWILILVAFIYGRMKGEHGQRHLED